ncbi:unnamed protein product [Bathycoccus prasinos]
MNSSKDPDSKLPADNPTGRWCSFETASSLEAFSY